MFVKLRRIQTHRLFTHSNLSKKSKWNEQVSMLVQAYLQSWTGIP